MTGAIASDVVSAQPPRRRRSVLRRLLFVVGAVVALLIVLVLLAPTLVSAGLGQGYIREAIADNLNGDVQIKSMSLGWFSGQRIEGLRIIDSAGKEAANLNLAIDRGLLTLLTSHSKPIDATISGSANGQIREDGSISFADLFKVPPAKARKHRAPSTKKKQGFDANTLPPMTLNVAALNVRLDDAKNQQTLAIDNLNGKVVYVDPGQPITVDLHGKTTTSGSNPLTQYAQPGSIDITGRAAKLFAADGSITLRGASTKFDVAAKSIPLPPPFALSKPATLQTLTINLASDDLTQRIALSASAAGRMQGAASDTTVKIEGSLDKIIDGKGKPSFRAASAHINAEATNLPIDTPEVHGEMRTLSVSIVSDDLTQKMDIAAQGEGRISGMDASGKPGGEQPSSLAANLSIAQPFAPDGTSQIALDRISGSASGRSVPTSLLQPMLVSSGIDTQRDLGPVIDIEAKFPGGVGGDLTIVATAPKASAEVVAKRNADYSITGSKLKIDMPAADPRLLASLTSNAVFSDRPLMVGLDLSSFALPAPDANGKRPLGQWAATGVLRVAGPANVSVQKAATDGGAGGAATKPSSSITTTSPASSRPPLPLNHIEFNIDTPALAQQLIVKGSGVLGGGTIEIDERITNLFDAQGALAAANAHPEGTLKIENLPASTVLAFTPAEAADLVGEILGQTVSASVITKPVESGLHADITARSDAMNAAISLLGHSDGSLQLEKTVVDATVTPKLAATLQKSSANPVVLAAPAKAHIDLQPVSLSTNGQANLLAKPMTGHVTLTDALIQKAPSIAAPLNVASLAMNLTLVSSNDVLTATMTEGSATLKRAQPVGDIASVTFDGTIAMALKDNRVSPNVNLHVKDLDARAAEAVLGRQPGTIAKWTGDRGAVDAHVESTNDGYTARIDAHMPNVQGTFTASLRGDMVSIAAETSKLVLDKDALQERLNPAPAAAGGAGAAASAGGPAEAPRGSAGNAGPQQTRVEADVPLDVSIRRCEFPKAMFLGEAFDPSRVNIDASLTGGPLKVASSGGVKSSLSDVNLSLRAADISKGVQFALTAKAEATVPEPPPAVARRDEAKPEAAPAREQPSAAKPEPATPEDRREARREQRREERSTTSKPAEVPGPAPMPQRAAATSQPQPGGLDASGTLADVVNSEGKLDFTHARLEMTAKATGVPTAVADALGDMRGMLVAAVGPQMNANFQADDFSVNSGTLNARIDSTNGHLDALLRGRENSLRVNKNAPVKGELNVTPELRERLLYKIHPLLADVRATEHPLRFEIPTALVAIPADVSQLRAEMDVTVGKVEFDSGSTTLKILNLFGHGDRTTIPGEIEPISAKIRNGIVSYDKFAVHIDKYTLNYSGQIDLVKQMVDLRTEIPLAALGDQVKELRDYADTIVVPLVTRGHFGALKTSIDPDFDLGKAAAKAGFKGALDQILKGKGGEDLFKQLFDKPKDK